jgi:CHASE2 domain-containing sensor protein/nitrogen-specific signal transduction histidine kinase
VHIKPLNTYLNDVTSTALLLVVIAILLFYSQLLSRLDNVIYDLGQHIITQEVPHDIIIVAIDEDSLTKIGRWPWSRQMHADLITKISQDKPLAIGVDIILSEPGVDSLADVNLAKAVKAAGNVVLPIVIESTRNNGQLVEVLPLPELMASAADTGRVHAVLDADSVVRSVYLFEGLGAPVWQLFSAAVLNVAKSKPSQNRFSNAVVVETANPLAIVREQTYRFNFLGPPGHFQTISYAQVLSEEYPRHLFANKIVLIGATALGMSDTLSTPVTGLNHPMSGVELNANLLQSLRQKTLIKVVPNSLAIMVVIGLIILPLYWLPKNPNLTGFILTLTYALLLLMVFAILPKVLHIWQPPSSILFTLLLAYPIWSWRKLDSAQHFLNQELDYLQQHLHSSVEFNDQVNENYDRFASRLMQVRHATNQLRRLQNDKKETLAFISHDLRAPIKSALMQLNNLPNSKEAIAHYLTQAADMADSFLQLSRAEMLGQDAFGELDLVALIHQAVDGAYAIASSKHIQLSRDIYEGNIWIKGNFGLLERALLNLILNAVKFAPKDTAVSIECHLNTQAKLATINITDNGIGIEKTQLMHVFDRFYKLNSHQHSEGAGLGLYFVKTVIDKHQGQVFVKSELNQFTTFSIKLPIVENQPLSY